MRPDHRKHRHKDETENDELGKQSFERVDWREGLMLKGAGIWAGKMNRV